MMVQLEHINVVHTQGGMSEFSITGVYPDYLVFESAKYNKRWNRRNIVDGKVKGALKINNKTVYSFSFKKGKITITDTNNQAVKFGFVSQMLD